VEKTVIISGDIINKIPGNLLTKKGERSKMISVCKLLRNNYENIKKG